MVKEIAMEWAERLPKYKQGQRNLRVGDLHCCMGVLCEMAVEKNITNRRNLGSEATGDRFAYGNYDSSYPPLAVCEWAGLKSREGDPNQGALKDALGDEYTCLIDMNDKGCTFEEIAEAIKQNWEQL